MVPEGRVELDFLERGGGLAALSASWRYGRWVVPSGDSLPSRDWLPSHDRWPARERVSRAVGRDFGVTTTPEVVVRPATAADLSAIGTLGALLVRVHHELDPLRFIAATEWTSEGYGAYLGRQLAKPDVIILTAECLGEVVGYTYAGVESYDYMALRGPAGVLYDIVVDPAHRGRGVGRTLLDATLAGLADRGAPRVVLSTADRNVAAQRLFERGGFRRTMIEMTRERDA